MAKPCGILLRSFRWIISKEATQGFKRQYGKLTMRQLDRKPLRGAAGCLHRLMKSQYYHLAAVTGNELEIRIVLLEKIA